MVVLSQRALLLKNMNRYVILSGYIGGDKGREDFYRIWVENLERNPDVKPERVFVICSRGQVPPIERDWINLIKLTGDLGHICRDDSQKHQLEGWAADVMIGALLAYDNESDLIYIESDCLPFGNFVSQMYKEVGDVGMIFGSNSWMPSAQSLFLVRMGFIPQFVHAYLGKKITDRKIGGEQAFNEMESDFTNYTRRLSFGWDRDRSPDGFAPQKGKVCYFQQISPSEIIELKQLGFIKTACYISL
jgi:hypothetical protein